MRDYDIRLKIAYQYHSPAQSSRALLRIIPRSGRAQTVLAGLVTAEPPPNEQANTLDFFQNAQTKIVYERALEEISLRFCGRVRRHREMPPLDFSTRYADLSGELSALQDIGPTSPHHFTGPSERIRPVPEVAAFVRALATPDRPVRELVIAVAHALHDVLVFDPTATDVLTDPAEAFASRRGVCQDFSHILIVALRSLGIPAGYVSGFLRTIPPEGQNRLEGADAMHAWVRAWCGAEAGWMEIDPTNDVVVGTDHVIVAVGRDYADVAPVKGSFRSMGGHFTAHQVDVVPLAGKDLALRTIL